MSTEKSSTARPGNSAARATSVPETSPSPDNWLDDVRRKLEGVRYGSVQIVVHDGRVTQLESTEKIRIQPSRPG